MRIKVAVGNERISYADEGDYVTVEEWESLLTSLSRLLAGGYERECSLSFERAGMAVDLYAYTKNGYVATREERRREDCVAAFRLLLRSKDKKRFLGGVYSLLLHRKDIEDFVEALRAEYEKNCSSLLRRGKGEYLFVGVSPLGYKGCNYWYLDPSKSVRKGDYVWVRMGRHNLEQIVYVDSVRLFDEETAPFSPARVKQVLRKATEEEV